MKIVLTSIALVAAAYVPLNPQGGPDLVDFLGVFAQHAGDAAVLTAFDQHLPAGQKALLPLR